MPANAQAPKGQKFNLSLQSSKRPESRSSYITKACPQDRVNLYYKPSIKNDQTSPGNTNSRTKQLSSHTATISCAKTNLLNKRQEQMLKQNRLSPLQMCVTRNNQTLILQRQTDQRNLQMLNPRQNRINGVSAPQPEIGQNLVVSAPSRVELLRRLADQISQRRLDVHVHVFSISPPFELTVLDSPLNLGKPFDDAIPIVATDQSLQRNQINPRIAKKKSRIEK